MAAFGEDLLGVVNRLQDLVFNTIGNDSLDLPQIVCLIYPLQYFSSTHMLTMILPTGRSRLTIVWKVVRP